MAKKKAKQKTKKFKTPNAIIKAAQKFLSDPKNWTQKAFSECINFSNWATEEQIADYLKEKLPAARLSPKEALELNETCVYCVLGAIGHYDAGYKSGQEEGVIHRPAGALVEQAARELYGSASDLHDWLHDPDSVDWDESVAVNVNDGEYHKTPSGAYKATLRILERALELSTAPKVKAAK